jgi:hypothetical protein
MADEDIVQKVVIEVDDTALAKVGDTAQTSFNKLEKAADSAGQSMGGVQAAAGQVGTGAQKLGAGLEQVTEKTVVTTRQMRAMGAVMRTVGEGAAASVAVGFVKIGAALGPIGLALFAAAEAFSYIKGKIEETKKAAQEATEHIQNIIQIRAAMNAAKGDKEWANDVHHLADEFLYLRDGVKRAYESLTSPENFKKGLLEAAERSGVILDDLAAGGKRAADAIKQLEVFFSQVYATANQFQRVDLEKTMKDFFSAEQIERIKKGTDAVRQAHDAAAKPFFTPEQQKSIDNLAKGWDEFAAASKKAWAQVAGDAETGARGWVQAVGAVLATGFANFMGYVGQLEHAVVAAFASMLTPIKSVIDTIGGWIQGLVDAAKALWAGLTGGGASVSAGGGGGMAAGGEVQGRPGTDTNLAWLTAGEFVVRAQAVRSVGLPFLHAINSLAPRFALGGLNTGGTPSLAGATAGSRALHLTIEGRSFGPATMQEGVASALERFAVGSQIASAGRKQSWRR